MDENHGKAIFSGFSKKRKRPIILNYSESNFRPLIFDEIVNVKYTPDYSFDIKDRLSEVIVLCYKQQNTDEVNLSVKSKYIELIRKRKDNIKFIKNKKIPYDLYIFLKNKKIKNFFKNIVKLIKKTSEKGCSIFMDLIDPNCYQLVYFLSQCFETLIFIKEYSSPRFIPSFSIYCENYDKERGLSYLKKLDKINIFNENYGIMKKTNFQFEEKWKNFIKKIIILTNHENFLINELNYHKFYSSKKNIMFKRFKELINER